MKRKEIGHVITHTHWDREWRYPIWKTREMLVECFDLLLDTLDDCPAYRAFLLDGQVVPVEDYLLIRPENDDRINAAVKSGRLFIGPWYTLPDEFPVDGECLVRNLLVGHRVSAKYGDVTKVGYTSFGWGQPAQLPQIYAGFGIDTIMFGKRVSRERAPKSEFLWEAPDGTRALTTRLGELSRQNFYFTCVIPACFGEDIVPNDLTFDWSTGGLPFKPVDEDSVETDYFRVKPHDTFHPERLEQGVIDAWGTTQDTSVESDRFMGDGCDFASPQPTVTKIIEEANKLFEDRELRHSTLPEYMDAVREALNGKDVNVVRGELRDGPASSATCNALATRSYIKHRNRQVQTRLVRRAEPLAAMAYALGAEYPQKFLDMAWDYLLKSHPHDSINGVTQDKTADDVMYRLAQTGELAAVVEDRATIEILKRVDFGDASTDDVFLAVFNPLPFPRSEVIKIVADTPEEHNIRIVTVEEDGREVPVQRMARETAVPLESDPNARPRGFPVTRHTFYMDTGEMPAGGYKLLRFGKCGNTGRDWPLPESIDDSMLVAPCVIENEYLRVIVNADGTFDLVDKQTGREYPGQLEFEDSGDVGTYWIRSRPKRDKTFYSKGCPVRTWVEEEGPLSTTIAVETTLTLPARADKDKFRRSDAEEKLVMVSRITLRRGARHVEVGLEFDHNIEDHRLRVMFPSGIEGASDSCAEGHFNVDRRPIEPRERLLGKNRFWQDMQTHPMQSFVDVSDGETGLAVFNDGLCEYEIVNNRERTVAITLMRAVRNWIVSGNTRGASFPSQKGGQCAGRHEFRFGLRPHSGEWNDANLYQEAQRFVVPVRPIECGRGEGKMLSMNQSLFAIEPSELVLSAIKKAEDNDNLIVRVYNPTDRSVEGTLESAVSVDKAELVNMNEEPIGELECSGGGHVPLSVDPCKIVTVMLHVS